MTVKLFDIRIAVDVDSNGDYVAYTTLGNNGLIFEQVNKHLADALCECICDMDVAGALQMIELHPASTHDFLSRWSPGCASSLGGGVKAPVPRAVPTNKPIVRNYQTDPVVASTGVRVQWSELTNVAKGQCEPRCIVHDNFAGRKCASFCPNKR